MVRVRGLGGGSEDALVGAEVVAVLRPVALQPSERALQFRHGALQAYVVGGGSDTNARAVPLEPLQHRLEAEAEVRTAERAPLAGALL